MADAGPSPVRDAEERLRVDVDALGLMAEQAVTGAMRAPLGDDRSAADDVVACDDLALTLLRSARTAWLEQDLFVASDVKRRDDVLDGTFWQLVAHLLGQQGAGAPRLVLHAHAAGRNLERIAITP